MKKYDYQDNEFIPTVLKNFSNLTVSSIYTDEDTEKYFISLLKSDIFLKLSYCNLSSAAVNYMRKNGFDNELKHILDALIEPFNEISRIEIERQKAAEQNSCSGNSPKKKNEKYINLFNPKSLNRRFFGDNMSRYINTIKYFYWVFYIPIDQFVNWAEKISCNDKNAGKRIWDCVKLLNKSYPQNQYLIRIFQDIYSIKKTNRKLYYECIYNIVAVPFSKYYCYYQKESSK